MTTRRPEPWLLLALAGAVAAGATALALPAQVEPDILRQGMTPDEQYQSYLRQRQRERSVYYRNWLFPYTSMPVGAPVPFHMGFQPGLRQMFPRYQGLPTYPQNVPGYGAYPGLELKKPGRPAPLKPVQPAEDRWPSWIEGGMGARAKKSTPSEAVLVQTGARVWVIDPGEEAYVPLRYFDKFRFLETGSRVQVRGRGELEVYCHDGSMIRSRGRVDFTVARLNREIFDLRLTSLRQVWLRARERSVLLTLPDATVLTVSDALLHIEYEGDRIAVSNNGPGVVSYQGAMGKGKLVASRYMLLWPQEATQDALGAGLELMGDVSTVEDQDHLRVTGGANGLVTFSGARFKVEPEQSLVLTPLAASRFPQKGVGLEPKKDNKNDNKNDKQDRRQ